jgi:hypothetical protein
MAREVVRHLDITAARPQRSAAYVESYGSGLSPIPWVAQVSAPSHMQSPRRDRTAQTIRRQTVKEPTISYIGLDIHKESIAIAIADADRAAPRFIGTINPVRAELCKAMRRVCTKESTLVVYEAGPCGYGWCDTCASKAGRAMSSRPRGLRESHRKNASRPIGAMRCSWRASRAPGI